MRNLVKALWLVAAMAVAGAASQAAAPAAPSPAAPSFEIVKDHVDIEASADGSYAWSREESYRVLDTRGIELLHQRQLFYTQHFETFEIVAAYTLKANGQRIDVPKSGILSGYGLSSRPGFQDIVIVNVFFPNLEVGDTVMLETTRRQSIPWFAGQFDFRMELTRAVPMHDVHYTLTAPAAMRLVFDQTGFTAGPVQDLGDKKRWTWDYHNDTPVTLESDAVAESDFGPRLVMTSFPDYAAVAKAYGERSEPSAAVTPEITAMAGEITKGITDRRAQARAIYDWVSSHIAYVQIVLGAGGFTPHLAKDVLANRFGDCKDHTVLLEALLKAKGIASTPVLIRAGIMAYKLSSAPSPHAFDHVITYLPEFNLYVDSTAGIAPFGVLPDQDAGRPVLKVATGEVTTTPAATAANSTIRAVSDVTIAADGTAQGSGKVTAAGALGVNVRAMIKSIPTGQDKLLINGLFGPTAEGTLDRGDPFNLTEPYVISATYRVPGAINVPGPGAVPFTLAFKPFSFTEIVGASLPASRNSDYFCPSLTAEEVTTFRFPQGFKLLSIPDSQVLATDGVRLQVDLERKDARTVTQTYTLKIEHPRATCTPEYYAGVRASLAKMANALHEQIIYKGPKAAQ